MNENELNTLMQKIYSRLSQAVQVDFEHVRIDGWEPSKAECHQNVQKWIFHNRGQRPVRGWLVGDHGSFYYFNAHSIIQKEDGLLMDITPSDPPMLFLRHPGTDEQFLHLIGLTPRLMYSKSFV